MSRVLSGILVCLTLAASAVDASAADQPFIGRWALTIPGGGAGWLGVTNENGFLDASILCGGGSVVPVDSVFADEQGNLFVTRNFTVERKDKDGKVIRKQTFPEVIMGQVSGDDIKLRQIRPRPDGSGVDNNEFTGKRIPDLPSAPDLSKVKYGDPIELLKSGSLDGWRLVDAGSTSGWSIKDGVLSNDPAQTPGQPHINYGNLRTDKEFEDFNLSLEVNVGKGQNSGIYLRGIYEVQVTDSYGAPLDSHNMGAVYSRITPSVAAEKPAGEWQTVNITLCKRHVTVVLNGKTIIDNQPLMGCTGGALWSDEFRPGPIYLQGDHTKADYRNIVLKPIVSE